MLSRLRESLLRDNRVVPVVLAILAILILAWVIFGLVLGGEDKSQVADQEIVAQSQAGSDQSAQDPAAPETENRNVDSYAAYEAKDPFRQLVEPASSDTGGGTTSSGGSGAGGGTTDNGNSGTGTGNSGTGNNNTGTGDSGTGSNDTSGGRTSKGDGKQRGQGMDSDKDGIPDRRENQLGLDPTNPDTDGDGIRDGRDDSNGDGRPDGGAGGGSSRGGGNGGGAGGRTGGNGGLFDSGGSLFGGGR